MNENDKIINEIEEIHKADIRLSDICNLLNSDWLLLAKELNISENDIKLIELEYPNDNIMQSMIMLRLWLRQYGKNATGNNLEQALLKIKRSDIVEKCIYNLKLVTDEMEKAVAKMQLDQSGFDNLNDVGETSQQQQQQQQQHNINNNNNNNNDDEKIDEITEFNGKNKNKQDICSPSQPLQPLQSLSSSTTTKISTTPQKLIEIEKHEMFEQKRDETPTIQIQQQQQQQQHNEKTCTTPPPTPIDGPTSSTSPTLLINKNHFNNSIQIIDDNINESVVDVVDDDNDDDDDYLMMKIPPQAQQEIMDLTGVHQHDHQILSPQKIQKDDVIIDNVVDNIKMNLTKISLTTTPTTPIKVKTIKKHSKIHSTPLKSSTPIKSIIDMTSYKSRPNIGDIEWNLIKTETSTTPIINNEKSNNIDVNNIKEISTIHLENVIKNNENVIDETIIVISKLNQIDDNNICLIKSPTQIQTQSPSISFSYHRNDDEDYEQEEKQEKLFYDYLNDEQIVDEFRIVDNIKMKQQIKNVNKNDDDDDDDDDDDVDVQQHENNEKSTILIATTATTTTTMGSSSDSDIALHEPGTELSDDETEADFYQSIDSQQQQQQPNSVTFESDSIKNEIEIVGATPTANNDDNNKKITMKNIKITTSTPSQIPIQIGSDVIQHFDQLREDRATSTSNNEEITDKIKINKNDKEQHQSEITNVFDIVDETEPNSNDSMKQILDQFMHEERKNY